MRHPPQVDRPAARAREVEVPAVGRPRRDSSRARRHRSPARRRRGVRAVGGNGPDVALPALSAQAPERDPRAARRPGGLQRPASVASGRRLLPDFDVHDRQPVRALARSVGSSERRRGRRRSRCRRVTSRGEAEVGQARDRLARGAHQEDAAAVPLGPERDPLAVWRERGLQVVRRRVGASGAPHSGRRCAASTGRCRCRRLRVDHATCRRAERRRRLDARLVGDLRERDDLWCAVGGARDCAAQPPGEKEAATSASRRATTAQRPAAGVATTEAPTRDGRRPADDDPSRAAARRPGRAPTGSAPRAASPGSGARLRSSAGGPRAGSRGSSGGSSRRIAVIVSAAVSRWKARRPASHLVEHAPEREDVGAVIDGRRRAPARATCSRRCPSPSRGRSAPSVVRPSESARRPTRAARSAAPGRSRGSSRGRRR